MIHYLTEGVDMPNLNEPRILRWLNKVVAEYGFDLGDITYIFCSDERILAVNRQYLRHDYFTDVITFDYSTHGKVSGDIYISLDTVKSNAIAFGQEYEQELYRILVHGVLHLTGQGDKTPESKLIMTEKEDKALTILMADNKS